jgi:hypothetical protein
MEGRKRYHRWYRATVPTELVIEERLALHPKLRRLYLTVEGRKVHQVHALHFLPIK